MKVGPFAIDQEQWEIRRGRSKIELTETPFRTLLMLVQSPGEIVRADRLAKVMHGHNGAATNGAVRRNIWLLRGALGKRPGGGEWIEAVHGRGYRFVVPASATRKKPTARTGASAKRRAIHVGPFRIDLRARQAYKGKREFHLEPALFDLFALLARHPGECVPRTKIIRELWGNGVDADGILRLNIFMLRRAVGKRPGGSQWIETVHGQGYRLVEE